MHSKSHFVLTDARQDFGVLDFLVGLAVDFVDGLDGALANVAIHAAGVGHIQNRVAARAALYPLVHAGQKAAAPHALARVGLLAPRGQHNEARQILVLGTQAINRPRAQAGTPQTRATRVHQ